MAVWGQPQETTRAGGEKREEEEEEEERERRGEEEEDEVECALAPLSGRLNRQGQGSRGSRHGIGMFVTRPK
jgi:hypothetical protein